MMKIQHFVLLSVIKFNITLFNLIYCSILYYIYDKIELYLLLLPHKNK